jgi:thioredoxin-like negative regulator of GroEL
MIVIESVDMFDRVLTQNNLVATYFSGQNCSVCQALKPKIETLLLEHFPEVVLVEVKTEIMPELSAQHLIFTIPSLLFFIERREYFREVRMIDISLLHKKLEKIIGLYNE